MRSFPINLLLGLACLLPCAAAMAQADDTQFPPVEWKAGDARTVDLVATSMTTRNDSVLLATESKSRYRLKVLAVKDTLYEVEFQDITLSDDVKISSDAGDMSAVKDMLDRLMADLQKKLRGFKYVLLVDRGSAQAYAVKNEQAMAAFAEEVVMVVLKVFFDEAKVELKADERKQMDLKLKQYMKEQMPAAMQTVVNSFNYIFQNYGSPYKPNGTRTNDVEMYYIDAIKYGDKESFAKQVITAKQTADRLTLDVVMNEDQRASYQLYVVDNGMEAEVPFSKFSSIQKSTTVFDRRTTWILRHESVIEVKLDKLHSVEKEVSVFSP
ncbi:MAG: hypothetical protein WAT74_02670 [Flavobacteriales bacterium]